MNGVVSTILGVILSSLCFSFLLNLLNNKMWSIFNVIRKDLDKLTNQTRRILNFSSFLLTTLITVLFTFVLDISSFEQGLILGFLLAIKDTCFKTNLFENK